jgi:glucokinase
MQAIAVDLGGTWMRAALVDQAGGPCEILRTPTQPQRAPQAIVDDLAALIETCQAQASSPIQGLGLGVPTTFDAEGYLDPCPNLPTLGRYPLRETLARRCQTPVALQNDAQCFALGEWQFGTGRGTQVLAGVTLGTGLGLGLVINGKAFRGAHGRAGEIWNAPARLVEPHTPFENIEAWVSGTGIEQAYARQAGRSLSAAEIARQAEQENPLACAVFDTFGRALRNVVLWIAALFDPEVIVLGGAVIRSLPHFYQPFAAGLSAQGIRVLPSELGESAALYGAAALVLT